jgi:hypothetical protein
MSNPDDLPRQPVQHVTNNLLTTNRSNQRSALSRTPECRLREEAECPLMAITQLDDLLKHLLVPPVNMDKLDLQVIIMLADPYHLQVNCPSGNCMLFSDNSEDGINLELSRWRIIVSAPRGLRS